MTLSVAFVAALVLGVAAWFIRGDIGTTRTVVLILFGVALAVGVHGVASTWNTGLNGAGSMVSHMSSSGH